MKFHGQFKSWPGPFQNESIDQMTTVYAEDWPPRNPKLSRFMNIYDFPFKEVIAKTNTTCNGNVRKQ